MRESLSSMWDPQNFVIFFYKLQPIRKSMLKTCVREFVSNICHILNIGFGSTSLPKPTTEMKT